MAESQLTKKARFAFIPRPPFRLSELLQSVICVLALQTHEPAPLQPVLEDNDRLTYEDSRSSVAQGGAPGGALCGLSWPSQVDNRKNLVFTYGDCLLPFLLTCKAALKLVDDVLLPLSISPSGPRKQTKLTLLMTAVIRNDLPLVHRIIEVAKGWNLDAPVMGGPRNRHSGAGLTTALTYAASLGHGEAVQALLDAGANPAKVMLHPTNFRSGLLKHPDLVSKIILSDAPLDFFSSYNNKEVENGTSERVIVKWSEQRIFLALDYEIPELVRSQHGVVYSEEELSETLFDEQYDDGHDPQRKWGAMRAFAEHPNLTFRHRTVTAGVRQDRAWLHELAAAASQQELLQFVLPAAASAGAIDLVRRALDSGGDVNQFWWGEGITSIVAAGKNGHLDVVELLADDDEIYVDDGLLAAAFCGHTSLVKRFLDLGADVDYDHGHQATLLYASIGNGHVEATRLLLHANATRVKYGNTHPGFPPLVFACLQDDVNIELVQLLLEFGADVNEYYTTRWEAKTPLIAATDRCERLFMDLTSSRCVAIAGVVQLLLDRGADPNAVDKKGHTALYHAENTGRGNALAADVLRKHSAGTEVHNC